MLYLKNIFYSYIHVIAKDIEKDDITYEYKLRVSNYLNPKGKYDPNITNFSS